MSTNRTTIPVPVDVVWSVLADGYSYADWVVGAHQVRDVDRSWPAVDSHLYHTVKAGPAKTKDDTVVLECETNKHLTLRGHARPYGVANITFDLESVEGSTQVTLREGVIEGPGSLLPSFLQGPMLKARNVKTLANLDRVARQRLAPTNSEASESPVE